MGRRANTTHRGIAGAAFAWARNLTWHMRNINIVLMVVAVLLTIATLATLRQIAYVEGLADEINAVHQNCQSAVDEMQAASDYLTLEAREYVSSGDYEHVAHYFDELQHEDRRSNALQFLHDHTNNDEATDELQSARTLSDQLAQTEVYALRLKAESLGLDPTPKEIADIELTSQDAKLSSEEKAQRAYELLHNKDYQDTKLGIREKVYRCSTLLMDTLHDRLDEVTARRNRLLIYLHIAILMLLLMLAAVIVSNTLLLLWPIALHEQSIRDNQPLEPIGAQELRHLTDAYNDMYDINHARAASLEFEASYDALTGVLNRGSFETLLTEHKSNSALILIDIDNFKIFNDEYGHEMGDAILIEVAATLHASFRSTDYIFRIGGDEFAVLMVDAHPRLRNVVSHKIKKVAAFLRETSNGLPAATISVGVAFGYAGCADDELFNLADGALYEVKRRGRDGFAFADDSTQP